jgi:hypothetical protein
LLAWTAKLTAKNQSEYIARLAQFFFPKKSHRVRPFNVTEWVKPSFAFRANIPD